MRPESSPRALLPVPPDTFAPGHVLGRYELLLAVAHGGMGTVWAARMKGSHGFSKIVAIKTMLPALSSDPHFERMFLSEAEIASRVKHPNVCEIFDLGEQEGVLYLVMEWIDGESLLTLLRDYRGEGKTIPYAVVAYIGAQAARGLHAAHELREANGDLIGVVHRDVSPHNILVTRTGNVKIIDFGVAKAVARTENPTTQVGHLKGKVHFMAPEQVFGDDLDRRTDIFTLGIVLYQLTTGTHPFTASHELATMARIASPEPATEPGTLVPDYPPELNAVIMRALAKDRGDRFASMSALASELEALVVKFAASGAEVETLLREALLVRAEKRAAVIKEAVRVADERSTVHALTNTTLLSASTTGQRRDGRSIAMAVGLVALGAMFGATALVWFPQSASVPNPSIPASAAAPISVEPVPSAPSDAAPDSPDSVESAPSPSPTASVRAVVEQKERTPAVKRQLERVQEDNRAKFRDPGF